MAGFIFESQPVSLAEFGEQYKGLAVLYDVDAVLGEDQDRLNRLIRPQKRREKALLARQAELSDYKELTADDEDELDEIADNLDSLNFEIARVRCASLVARVNGPEGAQLPQHDDPDSWADFSWLVCKWIISVGSTEVVRQYRAIFRIDQPEQPAN